MKWVIKLWLAYGSCLRRGIAIANINNVLGVLLLISFFSTSVYAEVVISEFMASNDSILFDEDGDAEDWIELHNTSSSSINLQNWFLSDDDADLTAWQLPNITLQADEYLVVFASNKDRAAVGNELHTNFRLSAGGEYLALVKPDGISIADEYAPEYRRQFTDISFGGDSYFLIPTPGTQNGPGVEELEGELQFDLAHGFFDAAQSLNMTSNLPNGTIRYSLDGSIPPSDFGCDAPADGQPWSYDYFEGSFTSLPDFTILTPIQSGTADEVSTSVRLRDEQFALRFSGCVVAPADGFYAFNLASDDGSQIRVNGELVVDNSNASSSVTASGEIALEQGLHQVEVTYFQSTGSHELNAGWVAPLRGQTYALTPDNGDVYAADPSSNDFVEFEFDLPSDGQFAFSTLAQGADGNAGSFWAQIDDGPLWLHRIEASSSFSQIELNNDTSVVRPLLEKGEHTLKLFAREAGSRIDALRITRITCDGPCQTQNIEAEIETLSGQFVLAGLDSEAIATQGWFDYTTPISIERTSIVRAVAIQENFLPSNVETQSYFFVDDIIEQSRDESNPVGWPAGNINGQDLDYGMDPDIVDPDRQAVKESLLSLPAISIVTDIDNMLHPSIGIYVNAAERGRNWERPASIELIDPQEAESGFSIDAGIRIRGGFSRSNNNPKHPFRLYFRGRYDGDLEYPLFGDDGVDSFERMDLRSPNNYNWAFRGDNRNTFLRELWSRDTQAALGHPHTRSRYYHLYINGQYWGINMTQERITRHYARSYFGGRSRDYDIVKHGNSVREYEASNGFNDAWNQIWNTVADQVVTTTEYAFLDEQVDIDNLIDYYLGNAYEGDIDGSPSWFLGRWRQSNNWYGVRDRENNRLKWSFFQHDGEHTLGARPSAAVNEVTTARHPPFNGDSNQFFSKNYMNPYFLHGALTENLEYRQRFIDRVAEVFGQDGALSNQQGLARWLTRKAEVQPAVLAHSARWGDSKRAVPFTVNDWENAVDFVESNVFADRAEIVFEQLLDIGLASDIVLPNLSIPSGTTVTAGTFLTLGSITEGTIYYTLDGSDPRATGGTPSATALQLAPGERIEIRSDTVLQLRVLRNGEWSSIIVADYPTTIDPPIFSIPSDTTLDSGTRLNITSPTEGDIYYTLDGSDPLANNGAPASTAIFLADGDAIVISSDVVVRARVFRNGRSSTLVTGRYFVEDALCFPIRATNGNVVMICL